MKKSGLVICLLICRVVFVFSQEVTPSGAFSYSYPIEIPSGTNGMQPNLSLVYNSQTGNGMLGVGWSLEGLSAIKRDISYPVTWNDYTDHFILDGQKLIYGSNNDTYHTELESFKKIKFNNENTSSSYWTVTLRNGTQMIYGGTTDSFIEAIGNSTKGRVWALRKVIDINGNYYTISYLEESGAYYPAKIVYNGETNGREIIFNTSTGRTDHQIQYNPSSVDMKRRLETIEIKVGAALCRKYVLNYEMGGNPGRSRILTMRELGNDGVSIINDLNLNWENGGDSFSDLAFFYNYSSARTFLSDGDSYDNNWSYDITEDKNLYIGQSAYPNNWQVGDVNGDGKTDLIVIFTNNNNVAISTYLSNGTSYYNNWNSSNLGQSSITYSWQVGDVNGDGKTDLIQIKPSSSGFVSISTYLSNGNGYYYNGNSSNFNQVCTYTYSWQVGDVNGDGKTDIIQLQRGDYGIKLGCSIYLSDGSGYYNNWNSTNLGGPSSAISWQVGDVNGDGLTDIIQLSYGSLNKITCYTYLSNGNSFYNNWSTSDLGLNQDGQCFLTGDVNGDGRTDIVQMWGNYFTATKIFLTDGNGFFSNWNSSNIGIESSPYCFHEADINGDGLIDICQLGLDNRIQLQVFSSHHDIIAYLGGDTNLYSCPNSMKTISINGINPDRIYRISSDTGKSLSISYSPATQVAGAILPTQSSYPSQANKSPRMLCTTINIRDGVGSESTTNYEYYNGKIDNSYPDLKVELGFTWIKKINQDGSYIKKWYRQDKPYHQKIATVETYGSDGNLYTRTVNSYTARTEIPATSIYHASKFIYKTNTYTYNFNGEHGSNPNNNLAVCNHIEYAEYNNYGNLTKMINHGDTSVVADDTAVFSKYAADTVNYRIALSLIRRYGYDLNGNGFDPLLISETYDTGLSAETEFLYYDSDNQTPLSSGQISTGGLYRKIQRSGELQTDYPDIITTYNSYDYYGNLLSWTDGEGNSSSLTYDSAYHAYPKVKTNTLGQQSETVYDSLMRPVQIQDENGQNWYTEYDTFGRQSATIAPGGSPGDSSAYPKKKTEYTDATVSGSTITYPACVKTSVKQDDVSNDYIDTYTYFDGFNRKIQIKIEALDETGSSTWKTTDIYYDNMGRNDFTSVPYKTSTSGFTARVGRSSQIGVTTEYDAIGRVKKSINTDTTFNRTFYGKRSKVYVDENDHVSSSYVEGASVTEMVFSGTYSGNPSDYMDPALNNHHSYVTTRTGSDGVSVEYEDAQGYAHQIKTVNDMLGRKMSYNDPDMGLWSYTYDGNGNIKTQTDARGAEVEFEYDELNRITVKTYPDLLVETYTYDETGHGYSEGRLTTVSYNGGSESYVYDERGRVTGLTRTIDGISKTMFYEYDSMDRITTETYPDGEELSYTYADDGNLDSIENDSSHQYIYNLNYTLNGKVKNFTSGNGTTTTYGYYDESGGYDQGSGMSNSFRLKSIAVENSSAVELANTVYNYDKLDNVAKKEFTNDYGDHYSEEFEYDFLNRLTSAESYSNNLIEIYGTKTYAYDSRNNITSKDGNTYSYDHSSALSPHAVQSVTGTNGTDEYEYDDNGNVITKLHDSSVVRTILYDGANRVSSISDGGTFAYDASGQRIKKIENGVTTCYFFDAYEEEHDGTDVTTIKYYFANGMRIAKTTQLNVETPITQYFHTDHLGSAVMMTDESGARLMSSTYTPYGSDAYIAGAADIKYKFTGQEEDEPTGLYYYGARYYDPELGRFLQADTYLDGLNRYAYCHDNPVKYVDPTGNMGDVAALAAAEADEQIANSDSPSGWTLPEQSTNDQNGDGRVDANERSQDSTGSVGGETNSFNFDGGADYRRSAYNNYLNGNLFQGLEDSINCFLELTLDVSGVYLAAYGIGLVVDYAIPYIIATASNSGYNLKNASGKGLNSFSRAGEFGIKPYNQLAGKLKSTGLQAHHLIEKRFANILGVDAKTMQSIALTPAEHQAFTNAWRAEIGYGAGLGRTGTATAESVMQAAQRVYANYSEILSALGF